MGDVAPRLAPCDPRAEALRALLATSRVPWAPEWVQPAYRGQSIINLTQTLLTHFGVAQANPLEASLGDLLVLPRDRARLLYPYTRQVHTAMIGRHGGLSPAEMLVSLLVMTP